MNKLRSELYSDSGLGSIRSELDALRSGGLEQIQQQVEQIRTLTLSLGLGLTLAQQVEQIEQTRCLTRTRTRTRTRNPNPNPNPNAGRADRGALHPRR